MDDEAVMAQAMALAAAVRATTSPNPWVGCVVTAVRRGHLRGGHPAARWAARRSGGPGCGRRGGPRRRTVHCTLEPCSHHGRTGPCADALVEAGVARVVFALRGPRPARRRDRERRRCGPRASRWSRASCRAEVAEQLAPYVKHRTTGRPWVVLKLAASADGRTAAPDGTSQWITGAEARADAHRLRAESDAVIVGAGTVRADDPSLTVRDAEGDDPLRVVLGNGADRCAKVHPALELDGPLAGVLDELGGRGVLQAMVEGGATVAGDFHRAGLVDRYVLYLAPALFGGDDGQPVFAGRAPRPSTTCGGASSASVRQVGRRRAAGTGRRHRCRRQGARS